MLAVSTKRKITLKILGIVTETHDAGIALLEDGIPNLVIEEERLNRQKHTREFPSLALDEAFEVAGHRFADIDVITTPWDMRRLRLTVLKAIFGRLPASLSLLLPSTQTTQERGIVLLNFWLGYNLKRQFRGQHLPKIISCRLLAIRSHQAETRPQAILGDLPIKATSVVA